MKKTRFYRAVLLGAALILGMNAPAFANCLPGIPCIEATPENPAPGTTDSEACDINFMNQMEARATLEAKREIATAEILIRKPDSVLELTCFDELAGLMVSAGDMFSNESQDLAASSNAVAGTPLQAYGKNNFDHDFLSDTAEDDYEFKAFVAATEYNCETMKKVSVLSSVNFLSRCSNIEGESGFFTFEDFVDNDPRILPEGMECPVNEDDDPFIEIELIDLSHNKGFKHVSFDPVQTKIKDREKCEDPVLTGLKYMVDETPNDDSNKKTEKEEKICKNPGCRYDSRANKCVK